MDTITIGWRKYGKNGGIQLDIHTIQGCAPAWTKHFNDLPDVLDWLLEVSSPETAAIAHQKINISNFGSVVFPCTEKDFSQYGFRELPPA
jgi:hypothetical protein